MTNATKAMNAITLRKRFANHAPTVRRVVSLLSDDQLIARFLEHERLRKKWREKATNAEHTKPNSGITFLVPDFIGSDGIR